MSYKKGQILTYTFPERETNEIESTSVIKDYHRVVVLHKRETPYDTVLIAPITKASSLSSKDKIPANYVELLQIDYPVILDEDSYINLDMTLPVDKEELKMFKKYDKPVNGCLNEPDLYQLDLKITLTYELNKYIKTELAKAITKEFENVVQFIDENIKVRVSQLVSKIDNPEISQEVVEVISYLISSLKKSYIKLIKENCYIK